MNKANQLNFDRLVCSFCNKHQSQVKRLMATSGGFFICDWCADKFYVNLQKKNRDKLDQQPVKCSVCLKDQLLFEGNEKKKICVECVDLIRDLQNEELWPTKTITIKIP